MSYTDNVADFMGSISELDGVSVEDLEAVAPEAIQKVRSQPNSPFGKSQTITIEIPSLSPKFPLITPNFSFEFRQLLVRRVQCERPI